MYQAGDDAALDGYWAIFRRRKWHFCVPFTLVLATAVALAYLLPATYRSESTILIERQTIPADLVESTVTGYVQEQIQEIRQGMVTYKNLLAIADRFDLYPEARAKDPGTVVRKVAESIDVRMLDIKANTPDQRGERTATIAFTVAFEAASAETAKSVTEALAERFLEEHRAARQRQAATVAQFLAKEARQVDEEIVALEHELARFKQSELTQLPELMNMNLKLYEKTEDEIHRTQEAVRGLQEKIEALQAELSLTNPYKEVVTEDGRRMLTGPERLGVLTAEYLRISARYSPEHPDVIRLQTEIRALARQTGASARTDELLSELATLQERLRRARQRYSADHPDVVRLEEAVAAVEKGLRGVIGTPSGADEPVIPPDNPRYVALKTQLDAAHSNLSAEQARHAQLQARLVEYEQRLFKTPSVERDFNLISRDYQNALKKYAELKAKQMQARLAQELELSGEGERLVLMDPAHLPRTPERPNRLGIVLLGILLSLSSGVGTVAVAEHSDRRVRGRLMVERLLGAAPLAAIPYIRIPDPSPRHVPRLAAGVAAAVVAAAAIVATEPYWGAWLGQWLASTPGEPPVEKRAQASTVVSSLTGPENHGVGGGPW